MSKLVIVKLGRSPAAGSLEDSVLVVFREYLKDVRWEAETLEGQNDAGRWFLFKRTGAIAVLVLGDPDRDAARARLSRALAQALGMAAASP